jgi:hypothetical protein
MPFSLSGDQKLTQGTGTNIAACCSLLAMFLVMISSPRGGGGGGGPGPRGLPSAPAPSHHNSGNTGIPGESLAGATPCSTGQPAKRARSETPPLPWLADVECGEFGFGCLPGDVAVGGLALLEGLPVRAGRMGVGVDRSLGGGEERVGLQTNLGGEFPGALGSALEAVDGFAVLVAAIICEPGCEVLGCGDLGTVEIAGPAGGGDKRADDALEVDFEGLVVHVGADDVGGFGHRFFGGFPNRMEFDAFQGEIPFECRGEAGVRAKGDGAFQRVGWLGKGAGGGFCGGSPGRSGLGILSHDE